MKSSTAAAIESRLLEIGDTFKAVEVWEEIRPSYGTRRKIYNFGRGSRYCSRRSSHNRTSCLVFRGHVCFWVQRSVAFATCFDVLLLYVDHDRRTGLGVNREKSNSPASCFR